MALILILSELVDIPQNYIFINAHFFLLFLSLSTFFIHHFHPYTKILTLTPLIPTLIPRIPTLIPHIPILIPSIPIISTLIPHIPTLIPRIPIIPTLIPSIPIIPLIPFPDSPFRLNVTLN